MSGNDTGSLLEQSLKQLTFGWTDYALFTGLLGVSALIGVYFGCFGKKQDNTTEYLMGGKTMSCFPVGMSLVASHVSAVSLLAVPVEVYQYGTQYAACIVTSVVSCGLISLIYLPVFYQLQLTSTFEYLEMRFTKSVRVFASFLYTLSLILYVPLIIYVPALAFSQATSINLYLITPIICAVCIFYTTIGGLRAVVWADTVQMTVTLGSLFAVLVLGTVAVGGVAETWRVSEEGSRIVFWNMDPSLFARNSFWGMSVGMAMTWLAGLGINQVSMQRFLAVPNIREAHKAIAFMGVCLVAIKWVSVFTGLIMYARYHRCDPISTHVRIFRSPGSGTRGWSPSRGFTTRPPRFSIPVSLFSSSSFLFQPADRSAGNIQERPIASVLRAGRRGERSGTPGTLPGRSGQRRSVDHERDTEHGRRNDLRGLHRSLAARGRQQRAARLQDNEIDRGSGRSGLRGSGLPGGPSRGHLSSVDDAARRHFRRDAGHLHAGNAGPLGHVQGRGDRWSAVHGLHGLDDRRRSGERRAEASSLSASVDVDGGLPGIAEPGERDPDGRRRPDARRAALRTLHGVVHVLHDHRLPDRHGDRDDRQLRVRRAGPEGRRQESLPTDRSEVSAPEEVHRGAVAFDADQPGKGEDRPVNLVQVLSPVRSLVFTLNPLPYDPSQGLRGKFSFRFN